MALLALGGRPVNKRGDVVQSLTGPPVQGLKYDRSMKVLFVAIENKFFGGGKPGVAPTGKRKEPITVNRNRSGFYGI